MIHLMLAMVWLLLGLTMIVGHDQLPQNLQRTFPGTNISLGWIGVFMAGWNVYRWRQRRARSRPSVREPRPQRARAHPEYHPEFDFTSDEPPPEAK